MTCDEGFMNAVLYPSNDGAGTMRTSKIVSIVALQIVMMTVASNAHASSQALFAQSDTAAPDPRNETIYRPTCWPGEGRESVPICALRGEGRWHSHLNGYVRDLPY